PVRKAPGTRQLRTAIDKSGWPLQYQRTTVAIHFAGRGFKKHPAPQTLCIKWLKMLSTVVNSRYRGIEFEHNAASKTLASILIISCCTSNPNHLLQPCKRGVKNSNYASSPF